MQLSMDGHLRMRRKNSRHMQKQGDKLEKATCQRKEVNPLAGKTQEEIRAILEGALKKRDELAAIDPFYFFEPTTGHLSSEMVQFLREYLKPEDIPQVVDGQLDVLLSKASIIGASGGNQAGKSLVCAIKALIKCTGQLPAKLKPYEAHFKDDIERANNKFIRGRVVGVDYKQMVNTVLPRYQESCPRNFLRKRSWSDSFSVQNQTLKLYRGNKCCASIEYMTNQMDVESFQGPPLDFLIYDEEPSELIHKENLMRFTTADKLDITFGWTPTHGISWATDLFSKQIYGGDDKKSIALFKLCSASNPKANLNVLREILDQIVNYEELKMRVLGEFISLSGLIYPNFNSKLHVIPPFNVEKGKYLVFLGVDPHITTETAVVWMALDRNNVPIIVEEMFKRATIDDLCDEIMERSKKYRMAWASFDYAANTNVEIYGTNIFQDFQKRLKGIWCRLAPKGVGSIGYGVNEIGEMLKVDKITGKPNFFLTEPCTMTINDFRTLDRDTYANEETKGTKDRIREAKKHRHACVRYIMQLFPRWVDVAPTQAVYCPDNSRIGY